MEECRIEFEIVHGADGADNLSMAFCGYRYREKAAVPRTIATVKLWNLTEVVLTK